MSFIPQLNTYWFPSQIFWMIVTFTALLLLMYKFFTPGIIQSIMTRVSKINQIENAIQEMSMESSELKKQIDSYEQEMLLMFDKAVSKIKQDLEIQHQSKINDLNIECEVESKRQVHELEKWKIQFLSEIKPYIIDASKEVVEKICR